MKTIEISKRTWKAGEGIHYEHVVRTTPEVYQDQQKDEPSHSFRVSIKRGINDKQSFARVDHWSGKQWKLVVSKPIQLCFCEVINPREKIESERIQVLFGGDHHSLLNEALVITGLQN